MDRATRQNTPEYVEIETGGLRLSARVAGSRDKPAIVLLHGWPLSSAIWEPVIECSGG